jgi:hypothetical protein
MLTTERRGSDNPPGGVKRCDTPFVHGNASKLSTSPQPRWQTLLNRLSVANPLVSNLPAGLPTSSPSPLSRRASSDFNTGVNNDVTHHNRNASSGGEQAYGFGSRKASTPHGVGLYPLVVPSSQTSAGPRTPVQTAIAQLQALEAAKAQSRARKKAAKLLAKKTHRQQREEATKARSDTLSVHRPGRERSCSVTAGASDDDAGLNDLDDDDSSQEDDGDISSGGISSDVDVSDSHDKTNGGGTKKRKRAHHHHHKHHHHVKHHHGGKHHHGKHHHHHHHHTRSKRRKKDESADDKKSSHHHRHHSKNNDDKHVDDKHNNNNVRGPTPGNNNDSSSKHSHGDRHHRHENHSRAEYGIEASRLYRTYRTSTSDVEREAAVERADNRAKMEATEERERRIASDDDDDKAHGGGTTWWGCTR